MKKSTLRRRIFYEKACHEARGCCGILPVVAGGGTEPGDHRNIPPGDQGVCGHAAGESRGYQGGGGGLERDPGKAVRGEHGQRETGGTQRPIFLPGMAGVPGEASAAAAGIVPG